MKDCGFHPASEMGDESFAITTRTGSCMKSYRKITVGQMRDIIGDYPEDAEFCLVGMSREIPLLQFDRVIYGFRDNVLMVYVDVMNPREEAGADAP